MTIWHRIHRLARRASCVGLLAAAACIPAMGHAARRAEAPAAPSAPALDDKAARLVVQSVGSAGASRIAMSPDGSLMASFGDNAQLWEVATGRLLCTVELPGNAVAAHRSLVFSANGKEMASAVFNDDTITVWDATRCGESREVRLPDVRKISFLQTLRDGRALVGSDRGIFIAAIFGVGAGAAPGVAKVDPAGGSVVAATPDGRVILENGFTARADGAQRSGSSLRVFDAETGKTDYLADFEGSTEPSSASSAARSVTRRAAISTSGRWIAVQAPIFDESTGMVASNTFTLYDRKSHRVVAKTPVTRELVLMKGLSDEEVKAVKSMPMPAPELTWFDFAPDEERLYAVPAITRYGPTGVYDEVRVLRRADLGVERAVKIVTRSQAIDKSDMTRGVQSAGLAANGHTLGWTTGQDLGVLDLTVGAQQSQAWAPQGLDLLSLSWTADNELAIMGRLPLNGDQTRGIVRWQLASGTASWVPLDRLISQSLHSESRDGRVMVAAFSSGDGGGGGIKMLDMATGKATWEVRNRDIAGCPIDDPLRNGPVGGLAVSDDHGLVATLWRPRNGGTGVALCLLDGRNGKFLAVKALPDGISLSSFRAGGAHFVPGGRTLWLTLRGHVVAYELVKGELVQTGDVVADMVGMSSAAPGTVIASERTRAPDAAGVTPGLPAMPVLMLPRIKYFRSVLTDNAGATLATVDGARQISLYALGGGNLQGAPKVLTGHAAAIKAAAFSPDGRFLASNSQDGATIIWDVRKGTRVATLFSFADGSWAVVDPQGRFDTSNLDDAPRLHWVVQDDPLHALPLELFMREYYEPRLLPRLLAGEKLRPVKAVQDLNRTQPKVQITKIEADAADAQAVKVTVEVESTTGLRNQRSGANDLRLFRNGQLVGYSPRDSGRLGLDAKTGKATVTFPSIKLPSSAQPVQFSAYAFNDDRIKSTTARQAYERKGPASASVRRRAYIVAIGVDKTDDPSWALNFAANDAKSMLAVLTSRITATGAFADVVQVPLVSEGSTRNAAKAQIREVLNVLAGGKPNADVLASVQVAGRLAGATPDDLVIVTFSGHGYTGANGDFYLVPGDVKGGRGVNEALQKQSVSSQELALWLRDIDAGEMALVIDACHSAASVDAGGFKPGPMGSQGLGQLAYDKGMRVLAASQADDVALESNALRHGLLTYALTRDGLESGRADYKPADKRIELGEWLGYGVLRVPDLYAEINPQGKPSSLPPADRSAQLVRVDNAVRAAAAREPGQKPALFDFTNRSNNPVIAKLP